MSSAIQNMLQNTIGDGARGTKFDALFQLINNNSNASAVSAAVKTASFPAKQHDPIIIRHKGRPVSVRGTTKFTQTWDCTFYLTEDHQLKNEIELWMEALNEKNNYVTGTTLNGLNSTQNLINKSNYFRDIFIFQNNFNGDDMLAKYTLKNAFPITVAPIQTSYEGASTILELSVTFAYSHFVLETAKGSAGNFIDNMLASADSIAQAFVNDTVNTITNSVNNFVDDQVGSVLNELNSWSSGLSKDIGGSSFTNIFESLNKGGLSPSMSPSSLVKK